MKDKLNVLVTAVGSEVGQGVIKALNCSKYDCKIVGCDMDPDAAGFFMCDKYYIVPRATSEHYLKDMLLICQEENINVIFPNADLELAVISEFKELFEKKGIKVLVQPLNVLRTFQSKYETYNFLNSNGIIVPDTVKLDIKNNFKSISKLTFPFIVKPDFGQGSKSLYLIEDRDKFNVFSHLFIEDEFVAQEYIPSEDEEYTCALFNCDLIDEPYYVLFKRKLKNGTTGVAEIVIEDSLLAFLKIICSAIGLEGSINIQFRKRNNHPFIFEINPRLSSTTGIRASCGFNDVEMAIDYFVFKKIPKKPLIAKKKVIRYFEEIYIDI